MLNLILFGPPGSGKGTQAEQLIDKYQLLHISTGDLLRQQLADETPLGLEAKKFMDQGLLVPDDVVIGMISSTLDENSGAKGIIFDGFPRTVAQAEALDKLLDFKNAPISTMISLEVSDEEIVKRILQRGETSGRSDDRDETIIRSRIEQYEEKTFPVASYYGQQGKLVQIKGEGGIEVIFESLCEVLDPIFSE